MAESDSFHIRSVFLEAARLRPAERSAFLELMCVDPSMRRAVERLLKYHDRRDDLIDSLDDLELPRDSSDPNEERATARRVGPYVLRRLLGRGGMGVVYVAQVGDGPLVALKTLRRDRTTEAFRARFAREIGILRRLDHQATRCLRSTARDRAMRLRSDRTSRMRARSIA